ncbi:MAG: secondary thiamine-phosphate synthase enzyme YjbQ [Prevotellaceae bacterium]|nr:secondary thiamine-phosphate synthase enzyme YjbQ [Prevotellaceae bacterium]MDY3365815.1 secondary thiamine-phosphate synthase enzyme YjbQ [Prevotella sp.]
MIQQIDITIAPKKRGFHLITADIMRQLPQFPQTGMLNLFVKHTSCALTINENADPDVRKDMEHIFNTMVPADSPYYLHTMEGSDDMPAHAKTAIVGTSINIPISKGRLNLGVWQGIYLCEFRDNGGSRQIVVTIMGE